MEEIEDLLEEGFGSLHAHLQALERIDKLEKEVKELKATGKRYLV